jgi:hypothetical protein
MASSRAAGVYLYYSQGCTKLSQIYLAVLRFLNSDTWLDKFCIVGTKFSIAVNTLYSPALWNVSLFVLPDLGPNPKCAQNGWSPMHLQDGERMLITYPGLATPSVWQLLDS